MRDKLQSHCSTSSNWQFLNNFNQSFSLHSWRYCLSSQLKFCWQSCDLKKGVGTRHLTYCLPENPGILNSPHTIVRRKRIGRGPYICQSRQTILRNFLKGADGKLLGNIMADSAKLSIDKALEDLNVSKEKQKIILIGGRKQLWRSFLLDVMLWQFCPQGSAKAKTEDSSWLLNSEENRNGIFVEGRRKEADFALLLQVRPRKTIHIKKDQKNHSKQVNNCPKQGAQKQGNLK